MKSLTYVEIDLSICANTYGVAPCTASVPTTGADKCYNCLSTCQDTANFVETSATLRFALSTVYLPDSIECIANLREIDYQPCIISLGNDLGQRTSLTLKFKDHPWSDTGAGFDPYFATRSYNPYEQGTFWGKFRARQPYLKGQPLRLITGLLGQAIENMETRHFLIDSFSGPTRDGTFTIIAKDVIKLADGDKAQCPIQSQGSLLNDITATQITLELTPVGIGDLEYDTSGYVCISGNEIVSFVRDQRTMLLLHANAADASTIFLDSSPNNRTATVNGNAQIDTAQSVFGGSSMLFDGAGDYLNYDGSSDFAFGTGDFEISGRLRINSIGADHHMIYDGRPVGVSGLYISLYRNLTSGKLEFMTNSAARITGTTTIAVSTWYAWKLSRVAGNTRLFVNGVQEGATYVDTNSYLNGASRPTIGTSGFNVATAMLNGWLDEYRVLKGQGTSANYTPAVVEYSLIASGGDKVGIVRGLFNTTAATHTAGDRVQLCKYINAQNVANIIYDLFVNFTNIDASYISLTTWLTETTTYLERVFTAMITEPTSVNTLIDELITEAGLEVWPDDVNQLIKLQVLRAISSDADILTDDIYKRNTLNISEQPETRLTQVWFHYGKINPTLANDRVDNYRSVLVTIDADAENNYGVPAIKKIFSRWTPQGGSSIAQRASDILLARYSTPPRKFEFDLMRYGPKEVILGGGYHITNRLLQDAAGVQQTVPLQVTQLKISDTTLSVVGEEVIFGNITYDGTTRTITIDTNSFNLNMKTLHDSLFPTIVGGETVKLIIAANVDVGSTSTALPALDVGTWPIVPTLQIEIDGRIEGRGGDGCGNDGTGLGHAGGDALKTTVAITLTGNGKIWGGGGGGNGGFAPGGGGAGINGGQAGQGFSSFPATDGTASVGGTSNHGAGGGDGGGPGLRGQDRTGALVGGLPGNSINGISHVTNHMGTTADIRGPQV